MLWKIPDPALYQSIAKFLDDVGRFIAADAIDISRQHLYDILTERRPVSPEIAVRLGAAVGHGTDVWLGMRAAYDGSKAERAADVRKIKLLTAAYPRTADAHG